MAVGDFIRNSQVWKSIFRHPAPRDRRNRVVVMLTNVQAKEWARDGIRVNAIAPGVVRTELAGGILQYLESHGEKPNPMNMVGEPADIARLVRYLVTDESRYMTGSVIRIDGGELL